MGDTVVLQKKAEFPQEVSATKIISEQVKNNLPTMAELKKQLAESSKAYSEACNLFKKEVE